MGAVTVVVVVPALLHPVRDVEERDDAEVAVAGRDARVDDGDADVMARVRRRKGTFGCEEPLRAQQHVLRERAAK